MPQIVMVTAPGSAAVLNIQDEARREPRAGEVRLKIEAVGLNRAELLYRQGQYLERLEPPSRIGYEGAGVVEAVGTGVDPAWLGARAGTVPGFPMKQYGLWAEEAIVPAAVLARTPKNLAVEQSAAIWMQYVTAYGGLLAAGEMKSGDTVLITAASSSVGLAAIEIARDHGNTVIATTRTSAKKQVILDAGADHVIATEEENLPGRVKEITGGRGVQVVFDPVSGRFVEDLVRACGVGARIVEYGSLSLEPTPFPLRPAISKLLTMRGYTLHSITSDAEKLAAAVAYITEKVESGAFRPRIAKVFHGLEEIGQAQDTMEQNAHTGKIVVVL